MNNAKRTMQALPHGLETNLEIYLACLKNTQNGKGTYLQIGFNVLSNGYNRRKVWHKFFIKGANAQALEVSAQLYWQMLDAIGITEGDEPVPRAPVGNEVVNVPQYIKKQVRGRIKLKPGTNVFADTNEISLFMSCK
jgi:hypothetical protein